MRTLAKPNAVLSLSSTAGQAVALALITAVGLAVAIWKAPDTHRLLLGLGYVGVLTMIAAHDMRTLRAPNRVIYPALAAAGLGSLTLGWSDSLEAVLGGLVSFSVLLVVALGGRGAMGAGDVKVGALCGMAVGLHGVVPMLLLTFAAGAAISAPLLLLGIRRGTDTIAFTPFMVAATVLCMAFLRLYLWG